MKKYITFSLLILSFVGVFTYNLKVANATADLPSGCTSTVGYSPLTGVKCDTIIDFSLPAGCLPGYKFSATTGVPCVSSTLPPGCTSTIGYSPLTGVKCDSGVVNISFPPGCTSYSGYSVTTGERCDSTSTSGVVISGVSGPQTLKINETGTWTVSAYDRNGGSLSYSVIWGDEHSVAYPSAESPSWTRAAQQSATFTHSYSDGGTFNPVFTVINYSGTSANTSLSVKVISSTYPPGCTSNVGYSSTTGMPCFESSLTVTSPNGGESWIQGTNQTIKWQDKMDYATCPVGSIDCYVSPSAPRYYDIQLTSYYPPCTSNVCPMYYPIPDVRTIAKSVYGSSYNWKIPYCTAGSECSSNFSIPEGSYTIKVCQAGTDTCDESNSYFKITSENYQPSITISSPISGTIVSKIFSASGTCLNYQGNVSVYYYSSQKVSENVLCSGGQWTTNITLDTNASSGSFTLYAALSGGQQATVNLPFEVKVFPPGCSSTEGYNSTTGEACALPSGCTSTYGWSSTTGMSCSI